ncbi:MAG: hypothetical protein M3R60_03825, partial [Pseudomonadota bacterium]|nr:hypothetical protein [Pseudomonadota bacterium]
HLRRRLTGRVVLPENAASDSGIFYFWRRCRATPRIPTKQNVFMHRIARCEGNTPGYDLGKEFDFGPGARMPIKMTREEHHARQ